ncbi:MAG TPA: hypothetical protein VI953_05195 [Candidatus Paceibacterota bacterium]
MAKKPESKPEVEVVFSGGDEGLSSAGRLAEEGGAELDRIHSVIGDGAASPISPRSTPFNAGGHGKGEASKRPASPKSRRDLRSRRNRR